jgi:opacity protein-like surface antigen
MKKLSLTLICLMLAVGAAMAQKTFTFGPKIGVDYTHFWGEGVKHGGQINYQAGVFMEYRFNEKFSIAPEVVFAAQGGKYKRPVFMAGEVLTTYNINYINVPVMLKYYVIPALSIDLGPQIGFNIYSKRTMDFDPKETEDIKSDTKSVDFGVGLGLTYNITNDVFVQGRYTMGVINVFKEGNPKNGNAQIAIGYRF